MSATMPPDRVAGHARVLAFLELGKIRLSALAVFAVAAGLYLGASPLPSPRMLAAAVAGTLLVAVGGNALNMLIEREPDRRMRRTQARPLPQGRLAPIDVLLFGTGSAAAGLLLLWLETNPLATALCALILLTYVLVYTPLKRVTPLNTLVGAVPGALPPLVGYAAASGRVDLRALVLFAILFFWQIPHFLAIAWHYRDDYRAGGMQMLSVVDPDGRVTSQQMLVYTFALLLASLLAFVVGLSGPLYLAAALCLGMLFLTPVLMAAVLRREAAMRLCFVVSILYLPLLLGIMVLDRQT